MQGTYCPSFGTGLEGYGMMWQLKTGRLFIRIILPVRYIQMIISFFAILDPFHEADSCPSDAVNVMPGWIEYLTIRQCLFRSEQPASTGV